MYRYKTLNRILASCLIVAISYTYLAAESLAAIGAGRSAAAISGDGAAEAVSRETRPRMDSRFGNSVDAGSGGFIVEQQILSLDGGRPLDLNLVYNSLLTSNRGPMGFGWSHNYEAWIDGDPNSLVTVHWDRNRKNSFSYVGSGQPYRPEDEAVRYDRLVLRTDLKWTLTRFDGTVYEFAPNGELSRVGNKVGQYLELGRTDGQLTSVKVSGGLSDRQISLNYAPGNSGLLQSITDQLDRVFYFFYDSSQRLKAIVDPTTLGPEVGDAFVPENIPDNNPSGLVHTINVSDSTPIGLVVISLGNVFHQRAQDLRVTLTSPQGTEAVLWDHAPGGPTLVFDDAVLDNFIGENPLGRWNLKIVDDAALVNGVLNGWLLRFTQKTNAVRYTYDTDSVTPVDSGPAPLPAPSTLTSYRGRTGERIDFQVTGSTSGNLWGVDVYTDDSSLAKAAVHAGVLRAGETGIVTATILPGRSSYAGSTRNGVTSNSWSTSHPGSFALSRAVPNLTSSDPSRIVRATDSLGQQLYANSYDSQGRVVEQDDGVTPNQNAAFKYEELPGGSLRTTFWNRVGDATVVEHDSGYHLLSVTDPLGNASSYGYDSATGDRKRITDALGNTTLLNYDSNGNVITTVDPGGFVSTFSYGTGDTDPNSTGHNVTEIRDALGHATTFTYDYNNNIKRIRDALGNEDNKTYNGLGQMTGNLLAGRGGINLQYTDGMPTRASHPAESGNARMEYDAIGRVTKSVDLDGYATLTSYTLTGQVETTTDPLGNVITNVYDYRDRQIRRIDANGNTTRSAYDGNNNLIVSTDALGQETHYFYDGEDRLVRIVDPAGNASTVTYDAAGRVTRETDPLGHSTTHEYDAVGREVATYDASGIKVHEVVYDARGLAVLSRDAYGHTIEAKYDAVGRLIETTDPLKHTTRYSYDELDRPTQTQDPLSRTSSKTYWSDDFVRRLSNPKQSATEFRYDPARRLDRITTPNGFSTSFTYNKRDLITAVTKPSTRRQDFTYDAGGRLTRLVTSGPGLIVPEIRYSYDKNGNLLTVSRKAFSDIEAVPRLRRTFDALDRMTSYVDGNSNRLDYVYDPAGNLGAVVYPDGRTVTYTYDAAGHLTEIKDWANRVTRYTYDVDGRLALAEFPDGSSRKLEYDANGRVTLRRDLDSAGSVIVGYAYSYDAAGKIASETLGTPPPPYNAASLTMSYDADNRLSTFDCRGSSTTPCQAVVYDSDGNMTTGPLGPSFKNYQYDHKGNLLSAGSINYSYDEEDRLIGYTSENQTTRFVVSPSGSLSQVLQKTDPSGAQTYYVYGIGLVYEVTGSQIRVYHYDARGSTVAFTGSNGRVSGTVAYGPFGEVYQRTGETDSLFLFNGLYGVITDPQGLNYMRFRWYSPQIKRFVNADAHYGDIAVASTLNRYAFAGNNPIMGVDPGGEFWNLIGGALVGGLVSVAIKIASDAIAGKKINLKSGDYWAEIGGAFVSGAVTGACLGSGAGIAAGAACGALGSSAGYLTTQGLKGQRVDPGQLAYEAAVGAAAGALTAGAGRYLRFGPKASAGNRFGQFRQGFRAADRAGFMVGIAERDSAIMASDEYLVTQLLPKLGLRNLVRTSVGRGVLKALARRAFTPTFGMLVGGSMAIKIGGRIGANYLFPSDGSSSGGSRDNADIGEEGSTEVSSANRGKYGEYIHWKLYISALTLATRPVPNNPTNVLATF